VRGSAAILVVAAHAAVIYAVAMMLGVVKAPEIVAVTRAVVLPAKNLPLPPDEPVPGPKRTRPIIDDLPPPVVTYDDPRPGAINLPDREPGPGSSAEHTGEAPDIVTAISVARRVDPVYPPREIRMGHEGVVRLRIFVDERGRARDVEVATSSGFDGLDDAAVSAVSRWQFRPATRNSSAHGAWTEVNVVFRLDR
jgi:protein TonB